MSETEIADILGDEKVRFHVVDAEDRQRSSDWIIWESGKSLYLAVASLSGVMKLSLHPIGTSSDGKDSQFSTTSAYWKSLQEKEIDGLAPFHRWKRPCPHGNKIHTVATVTFAASCLNRVVPRRKFSGKQLAFPLPAAGRAFELSIFNHSAPLLEVERLALENSYTPMFDYELSDREHASIMGRYIDFPLSGVKMLPRNMVSSVWLGSEIEAGEAINDAHAIAIHSWPQDGGTLALAELNGFALTRRK